MKKKLIQNVKKKRKKNQIKFTHTGSTMPSKKKFLSHHPTIENKKKNRLQIIKNILEKSQKLI